MCRFQWFACNENTCKHRQHVARHICFSKWVPDSMQSWLDSWLFYELSCKPFWSRATVMECGRLKMTTDFKTLLSLRVCIYVSPPECGSALEMLCPLEQGRVMLFWFWVLALKILVTCTSSLKYSLLGNWLRVRDTTWREMILQERREVND